MEFVWFVLWLAALTATVEGHKSCLEIQKDNSSAKAPYFVELDGKMYEVVCNMTHEPPMTIIMVKNAENVKILRPGSHRDKYSYKYDVNYGNIPLEGIKTFVRESESCKQYVSYKCTNASLFGSLKEPLSSWTSTDDSVKSYWAGCSFPQHPCHCDKGKQISSEDAGFLTKKNDLPVTSLYIGGLAPQSNVSFSVGNLMCYGDSQKGALTFGNRNSFLSLNLSSIQGLKFKFKSNELGSSGSKRNKFLVKLVLEDGKYMAMGLDEDQKLLFDHTFAPNGKPQVQRFMKIEEKWYSIDLLIEGKNGFADIDNIGKKQIFESPSTFNTSGAKLLFGDTTRDCRTLFACVKDVIIDGKDYTKKFIRAAMKEYVLDGCAEVREKDCKRPLQPSKDHAKKTADGDKNDDGNDDQKNDQKDDQKNDQKDDQKNDQKDDQKGVQKDGGGGGDGDTVIIVVVVVFLILLIILILVFLITWYLKRNKGVYQTHEGSAEDIHGDTDNLTLVTKPSDQDCENSKGKEYYL